ncbi:hypothetical protein QNE83_004728 [Vibrio alginolyticus]|nr:hypothetical protein [Vibrio alginolyticus]EGR1564791.1 hypothetical protein [Vibrio alginolyticus]EHA1100970.1 hypothetical protein [Vibrio alginolyticus]EHA1123096.1 hypothetical protein [Vibrio alginolyticus]EHI5143119.1 hypothetical protein [Vibrio alginolyticus]
MKHLTSALKDRRFLCDFVADLISLGSFFSFYLYKDEKKEQNDDELLFWSLLFIWGTSGEVLEKCFFYI